MDFFDAKKETLKPFNFKTKASSTITSEIIEYANTHIKREQTVLSLLPFVNIDIADKLEAGVFEFTLIRVASDNLPVEFISSIYFDKINDIVANLDQHNTRINNKTLLNMLQSGQVDPYFVAFFTCNQIHPDRWKDIMDKRIQIEKENSNIHVTDIYKCYKCGNRKTKTSQMQTRSADEPMTIFVTCLVCYNTFTK